MSAVYFAVKGSGNFPFHMLWLDQCYPATAEDAEKILMSCPTQAREYTIVLKSGSTPHAKAWVERNWPVLSVHT